MTNDKGLGPKPGAGRRKSVFGPRSPVSLGRRLLRDTSGQVLLFGVVLVVAILAFLLAIPNGTQVTAQKVRAQTAADVGAFTGSVWLARALNLNANMNIGIKSVYQWATVLTMGSALAQALYSDPRSDEGDVRQMGVDLVSELFGTNNPPPSVTNVEYPDAIEALDATAHWLADLQDDIVASFHDVAATLGTEEASRNAGAHPPSQTAGGWVLVRSNDPADSTPLLVGDSVGDGLMYNDLRQFGDNLESIPSGNVNIGPAVGQIVIDPDSFDIYAYYGFTSEWWNVRYFMHYTMFWIGHKFRDSITQVIDTQYAYFEDVGRPPFTNFLQAYTWPLPRRLQDSWAPWSPYKPNEGRHNPPGAYQLLEKIEGGNAKYKIDTFWWVPNNLPKWIDTGAYYPGGESVPDFPGNWEHDSTQFTRDYFKGADSTEGHTFSKVSVRRVNPDRWFHAVSYVWRQGATTTPFGLGPPMGGSLFPRSKAAATSPLLTVARSVPYLDVESVAEYDYYFTPSWDARLTPFDSVGVLEIAGDTAVGGYNTHTRGSFDNLQDLRRYVLLP